MDKNRKISRIFGIVFISTFLSYGIGSGLIAAIITLPDFLANVYANQLQLIVGVILMTVVHTFTNISLPILKTNHHYLAYGYLSAD